MALREAHTTTAPDPLRVLVVDDNLAHARLARALVEDGFPHAEVQYAGRLATAIRRLEGDPIDVVLLDLFLPDSQGAATLEELVRQTGNDVPIVVVTALGDPATIDRALSLGASDVLTKDSMDRDLVVHTITRAMQRKSSQATLFDSATHLLGRDAFCWMATKASNLAVRHRRAMTLIVLGPAAGSRTVTPDRIADLAERTFRDSDVIGRVTERHVAVLLPDDGTGGTAPLERLTTRLGLLFPDLVMGTDVEATAHPLGPDGHPPIENLLPQPASLARIKAELAGGTPEAGHVAARLPDRIVAAMADAEESQRLAAMLRPAFDVFVASSAAELLRVAALEDVSAVIVDEVLAGEGGDTVRRLGQQHETRHTPVLLAGTGRWDGIEARRAGFSAVVPMDDGAEARSVTADAVARARQRH
jgi:CheY-like chemotaxis protein